MVSLKQKHKVGIEINHETFPTLDVVFDWRTYRGIFPAVSVKSKHSGIKTLPHFLLGSAKVLFASRNQGRGNRKDSKPSQNEMWMEDYSSSDSENLHGYEENGENTESEEDSDLNEDNSSSSNRDNYKGSETEQENSDEHKSEDEEGDEDEQGSDNDRLGESGQESDITHMNSYWADNEKSDKSEECGSDEETKSDEDEKNNEDTSEDEEKREDEETSEEESKSRKPEMSEEEGEGHKGKRYKDTSEEEGGSTFDLKKMWIKREDESESEEEAKSRTPEMIEEKVGHNVKNDEGTSEEEEGGNNEEKREDEETSHEEAKGGIESWLRSIKREGEYEETSKEGAKSRKPEMSEEEGEDHSGKNDEDTSDEEEGNPYDIDDYESNKKHSRASNPVHDSIHKDFADLLFEVKQMRDFKRDKHHWTPGRHKPSSKQIDEVRIIFGFIFKYVFILQVFFFRALSIQNRRLLQIV